MQRKIWLYAILTVVGLFLVNYLAGWIQANRLSSQYLQDANAAYARGEYLEALTGAKIYSTQQAKYVQQGGYQQVERIWSYPFAWPRPPAYAQAQAKIQEIIDQRLTAAMAEAYVQANIGKKSLYLGAVYIRLGELYEESGDRRGAIEVYRDVIDLFPGQTDILNRASDHLTRLGVTP